MTTKRPLSSSSLAVDLPSDAASVSRPLDPSHQIKKIKSDDTTSAGQVSSLPSTLLCFWPIAFIKDFPTTLDPIHAEIRTAINVKNAIGRVACLRQLGYCPTKVQEFRHKFALNDEYNEDHDSDDSEYEYY